MIKIVIKEINLDKKMWVIWVGEVCVYLNITLSPNIYKTVLNNYFSFVTYQKCINSQSSLFCCMVSVCNQF